MALRRVTRPNIPGRSAILPGLAGSLAGVAIARFEERAPHALVAVAELMKANLVEKLDQPGSGRFYRRGESAVHQASAPGEPPAVDYGALIGGTNARSLHPEQLAVHVGVDQEHGGYLEFGTRSIEPRPFLRPVVDESIPEITEILRRELGAA